jgi:hypothetical protein
MTRCRRAASRHYPRPLDRERVPQPRQPVLPSGSGAPVRAPPRGVRDRRQSGVAADPRAAARPPLRGQQVRRGERRAVRPPAGGSQTAAPPGLGLWHRRGVPELRRARRPGLLLHVQLLTDRPGPHAVGDASLIRNQIPAANLGELIARPYTAVGLRDSVREDVNTTAATQQNLMSGYVPHFVLGGQEVLLHHRYAVVDGCVRAAAAAGG